MNQKQHKRRHQTLHSNLDELFADFIEHSGRASKFLTAPISELISWSHKQTIDPDHEDKRDGQ